MKKLVSLLILCSLFGSLFAQMPGNSELFDFNKSRNRKTSKGLKVLGGWALANMGTSAYMYFNTKGVDKSFHEMNVMWNGVNTLIVVASLLPKEKNDLNLTKTLNWQSNTEATYIANAALDLVYATAGLYLTERAKTEQHDRYKGWGNSLIYNGSFLFLFDTGMYIIHKKNGKKLHKMMDRVNVSTTGLGLRLTMSL
ncbi:MAG TPA: hypothetical protein VGC65_06140 [Bacteroidia bacterium]|jgi:hypothetical protein